MHILGTSSKFEILIYVSYATSWKVGWKKINLEKQCKKVGLSRMEWDYLSRVSTCKTQQL